MTTETGTQYEQNIDMIRGRLPFNRKTHVEAAGLHIWHLVVAHSWTALLLRRQQFTQGSDKLTIGPGGSWWPAAIPGAKEAAGVAVEAASAAVDTQAADVQASAAAPAAAVAAPGDAVPFPEHILSKV